MMSEVVAAKPDSAKAHYIYTEMLARNRNFTKASKQAARACQLDPVHRSTRTIASQDEAHCWSTRGFS